MSHGFDVLVILSIVTGTNALHLARNSHPRIEAFSDNSHNVSKSVLLKSCGSHRVLGDSNAKYRMTDQRQGKAHNPPNNTNNFIECTVTFNVPQEYVYSRSHVKNFNMTRRDKNGQWISALTLGCSRMDKSEIYNRWSDAIIQLERLARYKRRASHYDDDDDKDDDSDQDAAKTEENEVASDLSNVQDIEEIAEQVVQQTPEEGQSSNDDQEEPNEESNENDNDDDDDDDDDADNDNDKIQDSDNHDDVKIDNNQEMSSEGDTNYSLEDKRHDGVEEQQTDEVKHENTMDVQVPVNDINSIKDDEGKLENGDGLDDDDVVINDQDVEIDEEDENNNDDDDDDHDYEDDDDDDCPNCSFDFLDDVNLDLELGIQLVVTPTDIWNLVSALGSIFAEAGDYILSILLRDLKRSLHHTRMDEKFNGMVDKLASSLDGDNERAVRILKNRIRKQFGKSYQIELVKFLKVLRDNVRL